MKYVTYYMFQSVRSEMEKSFIGQEDQMSKLRTEVGANLNSLNYDISGLLQFKNESGKRITVRRCNLNDPRSTKTFFSGFDESKSE